MYTVHEKLSGQRHFNMKTINNFLLHFMKNKVSSDPFIRDAFQRGVYHLYMYGPFPSDEIVGFIYLIYWYQICTTA